MQIKHPSRSPLRAVVTMCGRQTSGWGRPPQLRWSGLPRRYLRRRPARRGLVASTLKGATGGRTQSRWGQRPCRACSTRSSSRRSGRRAGQIPERNGAVLGGGGVGSVEFDQVIRESMQQIEKLAKELDPNPESGDDPTHGETHHSTRKPAGGGGPRLFD